MSYVLYPKPDPHFHFIIPDPGKDFAHGQEAIIAARLDVLAQHLHRNVFGISGYRTPAQSVAAHGFANDPHTKGLAADIGIGNQLRSSAAGLTEAQLESVGLTRPFGGPIEINHVQPLPGWKGDPSALEKALTFKQDHQGSGIPGVPDIPNPIDAAKALPGQIVDAVATWIGQEAMVAGLYVALVGGGLTLLVVGLSRALGVRREEASA